jgi:uric acid-xanthine permease
VFTYKGNNHALAGFYNAIELVMETGFAVTGFLALILNLLLPEEIEDEEIPELTANEVDEKADEEEWARIQRGKDEPTIMDPEKARTSGSTAGAEPSGRA